MRYVYKGDRLIPNVATPVLEYDDHGNLVGAYKGYYNFKKYTVALYPDYKHPFAHWRGTPQKKVISASHLERERGRTPAKEDPRCVKSTTGKIGRLPMEGQEVIKL